MANYRRGRINEQVQKELSVILRQIKDPTVSSAMISITDVVVTPDLKYATAYFSVLGGDPKEVKRGLERAKGFIRREIAVRLNFRNTPEFNFEYDSSIAYGAHISKILEDLGPISPEDEQDENN